MTKIKELVEFDKNISDQCFVIGTDEAGRGPGAGPVFAAAVCFKNIPDIFYEKFSLLNDSKKLSHKHREELFDIIKEYALFSVQQASVLDIEKKNILNASLDTMKKACEDVAEQLKSNKIKILVDGNKKIKNYNVLQTTVVKGDSKSAAIAAASILAKVARDRFMEELDREFPQYGWKKNKGYLTAEHVAAIKQFGITKWHRKKFLRNILEEGEKQLSLL